MTPVDADRREQERRAGEDGEQQHRQPTLGHRVGDDLVHRLHVGDDELGIERAHEADDGATIRLALPAVRTVTVIV
jgi:hypothetical protein